VVLLEDIHIMRREAANSLLKTLEEPPEGNLLILTAESSKNILPTISSRCQVIPFFPLSLDDTVQVVQQKIKDLEKETAVLLARLSEGSPGRALLFKEMEMVETWKKVITVVRDSADAPDGGVSAMLRTAEKMADLKENLIPFLGLIRIWIRDMLVPSPVDRQEAVAFLSGTQGGQSKKLFEKLQAVDQAERELARNCNRTLVCEVLLFRLQK
jgi:DNA polymerase-3 subunit delta'